MATLKQRVHRMNSSGSYDTVHYETSSDLVLRPSGRTVEQDLTDYLPKVQNSDTAPSSLTGALMGSTKAWYGTYSNTPVEISRADHTHSGYAASSHTHAASAITSGTIAAARLPIGQNGGVIKCATVTNTLTNVTMGSRSFTTVLTNDQVKQFTIAKLTVSGTVTVVRSGSSTCSVWITPQQTNSSSYAFKSIGIPSNSTAAINFSFIDFIYKQGYEDNNGQYVFNNWGNYKIVSGSDATVGVYFYDNGTITSAKINTITATLTGMVL